ncbi:MAG: M99 family carboxypeptidase catalytic domain-containing protein [Syntrophales bacterium]|nr:M99 family carboxypeptidase catalytic domain-containing protein [Syntrophales bacterium]MDP3097254.1 M99 family carboxypeptidase catalytic domain-containing protein [Syntrophales bacterium]
MANHRRIKNIVLFCVFTVFLFPSIPPLLFAEEAVSAPAYQQKIYFPKTRQQLTVHFISGLEKGPTLLVFGGIHGDERAGYLTAGRFTHVKIKNGSLILAPRLNAAAIKKGTRQGLGGDMNRLFDLPEKTRHRNPDTKVVDLSKSLIQRADYVINLHQAYDFYADRWISRQRNPSKWGQSNVIDTPTYTLRNGDKLEPGRFAQKVARRSNDRIKNRDYQFLVNNTETSGQKSRHMEQRGSLTYYALTKQHKIALAIEATKNCSLPEAIAFLTIAVNAALEEAGIQSDNLPSEDFLMISREIKEGNSKPKI